MWAALLASAAIGISSYHIHFVSIIAQLSPKQGELLASLIGTDDLSALELARDNIFTHFESHSVRKTVEECLSGLGDKTIDTLSEAIDGLLTHIGITGIHAAAESLETKDYFDIRLSDVSYKDDDEVDYSILEAVGLIRRVDTGFLDVENWALLVQYYYLTDLGFYFAKACGIVHDNGES